ncbi:hypothetical protein LINGRAPRIM_LOCUS2349 [Linum grandiflorum]
MTSRNINLNVMQDHLSMLWRPGYGMTVEDLGDKHYLFRFNHGHDLRWVLDNRPWMINDFYVIFSNTH